jgi:hypothetical protein
MQGVLHSCAYAAAKPGQALNNQALILYGTALANILNQTGFVMCDATEGVTG